MMDCRVAARPRLRRATPKSGRRSLAKTASPAMTSVVIASMRQFPPRRIVCLTEETVETLYLLGEQDRIVGVSGYAVRPPQVRREKPRVSAFISAAIVADLVRAGVAVHVFNQRDIKGILAMIRTLGALVGAAGRAELLAAGF